MDTYIVKGPFTIPSSKMGSGTRFIEKPEETFWKDLEVGEINKKKGCYVFGIRSAKGIVPYYVGKATKTFEKEVFTSDKLQKYNSALTDFKKATPVIFFIIQPTRKWSKKEISDIEKFLIPIAYLRNPDIKNSSLVAKKKWSIKNIISSERNQKKPNKSEKDFKSMMGIIKKMK
jgi:hypothetical protein